MIFGFVCVGLIGGILYLGFPYALSLFRPVQEKTLDIYELKNKMEKLFEICAYEYHYDTIITKTKALSLADIEVGKNSKLLISSEGIIKAGCTVKRIEEDEGNVIVTLSEPHIIESYVLNKKIIESDVQFYNKFDITEDKDAADRVHIKTEENVHDELVNGALEKTENVLSAFLVSSGVDAERIQYVVE